MYRKWYKFRQDVYVSISRKENTIVFRGELSKFEWLRWNYKPRDFDDLAISKLIVKMNNTQVSQLNIYMQ